MIDLSIIGQEASVKINNQIITGKVATILKPRYSFYYDLILAIDKSFAITKTKGLTIVDYYDSLKEFYKELTYYDKDFILKIDPYLFDSERFTIIMTYQKFIENK